MTAPPAPPRSGSAEFERLLLVAQLGRRVTRIPRNRPVDASPQPRITALLPAHNEEATLPAALASLRSQLLRPARVIVVADNCTDHTAAIAAAHDVEVFETRENTAKKAGALNQALSQLLPTLPAGDLVLIMDADSMIVPRFLEVAARRLAERPDIGAVGGIFYGEPGAGLLGALQRNEYARYARELARKQGQAVVLTGTASVFRVGVLREIADRRGRQLPGGAGQYYDTTALTEDNEVTLAIKTLGLATLSPRDCGVITEVMPTWRALWRQRLRWQRGAIENLRAYGFTRITRPYLLKQAAMYIGILAVLLFLISLVVFATLGLLTVPTGWWLALSAVFVVERVWTVRRRGWRAMVLAAPLVVEFGYDLFQQAVYLQAMADIVTGRARHWHHLAGQGG